jgi:pimeloyl-ACP methyl ester carboxylesterase
VATVASVLAVTDDRNARVGGQLLAADMANFREWAPADARFVALGFSMGSTVVSAAAAEGAQIDDLVLMGSPGASTKVGSAADYPDLAPEHTFVVAFDQDPVTRGETDVLGAFVGTIGRLPTQQTPFGPDPTSSDFGAQVVDVQSPVPDISVSLPMPGGWLAGALGSALVNEYADVSGQHSQANYLSGESLEAVGAVLVGHYTDVPVKPGH